ncbi:MAG: hypothetical protein AAFZ15_34195 [Bacteroidota bacterium]
MKLGYNSEKERNAMKIRLRKTTVILFSIFLLILSSCEKEDLEKRLNLKFEEITRDDILAFKGELSGDDIVATNESGNILDTCAIVFYKTQDGRYGKFKILDIGEFENNALENKTLFITAVTYANNGSVFSQTESLSIRGTWTCDLDAMEESGPHNDFHWERVDTTDTLISPIGDALFSTY